MNTKLVDDVCAAAATEGFVLSGITPAVDSGGFGDLVKWIDAGYCAEMDYFADRLDAYRHPSGVLAGAKSVIALAYPYPAGGPISASNSPGEDSDSIEANHGRVARYTWIGQDYHDVIHPKLKRICRIIRDSDSQSHARGVVDTAPLMEREIAQLAGLGWRGKNTLLLNRQLGSYFFLACVLVDVALPFSEPHQTSHCGTCTACLDACPTDAFAQPGVLDASKCISYLTIEHRDSIPLSYREAMGDWMFGCDVCQEVCPWNTRPSRLANSQSIQSNETNENLVNGSIELTELFWFDDDAFRTRFRKTPMWRTRRRGLLRNAAIVLGNVGQAGAVHSLRKGQDDDDPVVREACDWAIEKIQRRTRFRDINRSGIP